MIKTREEAPSYAARALYWERRAAEFVNDLDLWKTRALKAEDFASKINGLELIVTTTYVKDECKHYAQLEVYFPNGTKIGVRGNVVNEGEFTKDES